MIFSSYLNTSPIPALTHGLVVGSPLSSKLAAFATYLSSIFCSFFLLVYFLVYFPSIIDRTPLPAFLSTIAIDYTCTRTMPSVKSLLSAAALACLASGETIKITATSSNTFDPSTITASHGDTLEFHFESKNHSVVSGLYAFPCTPVQLGTGFFSGFTFNTTDGEAVCGLLSLWSQLACILNLISGQSFPRHGKRNRPDSLLLLAGQ